MIRSMVCAASCVCRVANTGARFPRRSAPPGWSQIAHLADQDDVGSCRKTCLRASAERVRVRADLALVHQTTAVAVQNSIGSSTVMMWSCRWVLAMSINEARLCSCRIQSGR